MEGETDFDPTTEEGQVDINDEEYDSLIPNDNVDPEGYSISLRVGSGIGRALPGIP